MYSNTFKFIRSSRIVFFILFMLIALPFFAQEGFEVNNIKFEGNKTFKKLDLMAQISMHQTNLFQRVVQKKEPTFYNS